MKIGVFDSGIGGLSVLHQAMQMLPQENFIYYADIDHVPYGTKTKEEILKYSSEAVDFLVQKGVKAIVIACNTATSAAIQELREKYTLPRSEEHTSELQSRQYLVCRLLLEK